MIDLASKFNIGDRVKLQPLREGFEAMRGVISAVDLRPTDRGNVPFYTVETEGAGIVMMNVTENRLQPQCLH